MYERKFKFSDQIYERMINHVFLCRKPPDGNGYLEQVEVSLLAMMDDVINDMGDRAIPNNVRVLFDNMYDLYGQNVFAPEKISNQIQAISNPDDMMGIYVRNANCGLFLLQTQPQTVTLATFQANLANKHIYGSAKNPNNDLQVDYPTRAVKVKMSDLIKSEVFAEQIKYLHKKKRNRIGGKVVEGNDVDVSSTKYVSQWLIGAVSNRESGTDNNFPIISKKMRDESSEFFRRSGFWTTIKVFLHLGLSVKYGNEHGELVYKLTMLKFLCSMCDCFNLPEYASSNINVDIALEMLSKMARRVDKLSKYSSLIAKGGNQFYNHFVTSIKREVVECISKVRTKLKCLHDEMIHIEKIESELKFERPLNIHEHVKHNLSDNFKQYLEKRKNANNGCIEIDKMGIDQEPESQSTSDNCMLQELIEAEEEIFQMDINYDPCALRDKATSYITKAKTFYQNDPFGYSRMLLAILKIIQILDKIACEKHELLLKHRSGILITIFESLIVSSRYHLEILYDVQKYFERRNQNAVLPGLLEEDEITEKSFSAQFVNDDMHITKLNIEKTDKKNIKKKGREWEKERKKFKQKCVEVNRMCCTFPRSSYSMCRRSGCRKCDLQNEIDNTNIKVYQCLLKPEPHNRNAIIFELRIPIAIACLRDVLFLFMKNHYNGESRYLSNCILWTEHSALKEFSNNNSKMVFLVSSSNGARTRSRASVLKKHINCPLEAFIDDKLAEYNCMICNWRRTPNEKQIFMILPKKINLQPLKKMVTYKVEDNSMYKTLQWTLESFLNSKKETALHTQNEVLALQSQCPPDMNSLEFISFGSLRADGHNLWCRNLYRVISDESLSFEKSSVLALVMQTLWESGPLCDNAPSTHPFCRKADEDFTDIAFANVMIKQLDTFIVRNQSNWRHPLKILVAVLIACRIFEMNTDHTLAGRIMGVLFKCRRILNGWMPLIRNSINQNLNNEANLALLYQNSVNVAICGIFTYFIDKHHPLFNHFLKKSSNSAVHYWLEFLGTINRNNNHYIKNHLQLLRMAYTIGLNIKERMQSLILRDDSEVRVFVGSQYSESHIEFLENLRFLENGLYAFEMIVSIDGARLVLRVNYVYGEFLVNGAPMGRLPNTITETVSFKRVFGNTIIDVTPLNGAFETRHPINGHTYTFHEDEDDGLIIIQHDNQNSPNNHCELIPHSKLMDEVSVLLVENFNHWLNKRENVIEFRPTGDLITAQPEAQYQLKLDSCHLEHLPTKRWLLDIKSASFKQITKLLSRLEHEHYIHVLMEKNILTKATIELVRMNLNFDVDCSPTAPEYSIISREYRKMRVCKQQNFGTLLGLRHGLLLESMADHSTKRLLIMPHGTISVNSSKKPRNHVTVKVKTDVPKLREPPFFLYEFKNECRTLNANNFATWFYLAYLHAVTSHPLPDPFTGMSGVERALQILQTGFVWSAEPYDSESLDTMKILADLSPRRQLQSQRLYQITQWPTKATVHHHVAQDAFKLIVNKLIADSTRLQTKDALNSPLNLRAYIRYMPYAPNCRISESLMTLDDRVVHFKAKENDKKNMTDVRQLAADYSDRKFHIPSVEVAEFISKLLQTEETLTGRVESVQNPMDISCSKKLANLWIDLYESARNPNRPKLFHMILCMLAFEGDTQNMSHLYILRTIAANEAAFASLPSPIHTSYENPAYTEIDSWTAAVDKAIKNSQTSLNASNVSGRLNDLKRTIIEKMKRINIDGTDIIDSSVMNITSSIVNVQKLYGEINSILNSLRKNRELKRFIRSVGKKFSRLRDQSSPLFKRKSKWTVSENNKQYPINSKYIIDFNAKICQNYQLPEFANDIEKAKQIYIDNFVPIESLTLEGHWKRFIEISIPKADKYLNDAALFPRLVPVTTLPMILPRRTKDPSRSDCHEQKYLIGALAMLTSRIQKRERIKRLEENSKVDNVELMREKENPLHQNWEPHFYPEWLLFEIEMDVSIRRTQVNVAKEMINPRSGKHSVMQLNMGEGKTSIILPIVAAHLANGDQLSTVTVLKHLFQTNLPYMRQCVGGLLGRRVYTMPYYRKMEIVPIASKLLNIYEECKREHGIWLTLPEYRLSFQLKMYELAQKEHAKDNNTAKDLYSVHNWLDDNSRHILDESDAILQSKYQLIYTIGNQSEPDGGALRWTCVQAVLKRVPFHMKTLYDDHGDQKIEFNCEGENYANRLDVFRPCRLLDASVYEELKLKLIDDFIEGLIFPEWNSKLRNRQMQEIARELLQDDATKNINQFQHNSNTILILRGLLKFEVLRLALSKRWRVNYGRNVNGPRKMAVPFKAKDVASDMTEFGHPDVAICLTQLSYYYSGLSDEELIQTFQHLEQNKSRNAIEIYREWIKPVPSESVDPSIKSYKQINLLDSQQRIILFRLLKRNMYVIDYWLSNVVFPREAKVFDRKLMCTPWDLCTEHLKFTVTGFSGTNDSQNVLPMPIEQNDLEELEETNEKVRQNLMREENDHYQKLPPNIKGIEILEKLNEFKIPVLLDAGALMLELENAEVAREWLELVSKEKYRAAIYFDAGNILQTVDRDKRIVKFEYSVYREQLHHCLVYLDDEHTRGTDLKFPKDMHACVTLSGGITRDKTVQACMRMRLLGKGHRVSFWASHEADIGIRKLKIENNNPDITGGDVMKYIENNSAELEKNEMAHWSIAALNYTQKLAAHKELKKLERDPTQNELCSLGRKCSAPDISLLEHMFGSKKKVSLRTISLHGFTHLKDLYVNDIYIWICNIEQRVTPKLGKMVPGELRYTAALEEQQEKVLENELDENRDVVHPQPRTPLKPCFEPELKNFVEISSDRCSAFSELKKTKKIETLPHALKNAEIFSIVEPELSAWDERIFVTKDFMSVIDLGADDKDDKYLRPVWWIVHVSADADDKEEWLNVHKITDAYVVISPFECKSLLPVFRECKMSSLHMFCAKLSKQQEKLINNKALILPQNSNMPDIPIEILVQISMFAGSMYFDNENEQNEYCNFMGFIPEPRTPEQERIFDRLKLKTSFIPIRDREDFPAISSRFKENPEKIAIGLIERRFGNSRKRSHVESIIFEAKKSKLDNED